jgi:hypothetical protein
LILEPRWSFDRVFEPRALSGTEQRQGGLEITLAVVRARPVRARTGLDRQYRLGSQERDAVPVAGDVVERASEDAGALPVDPEGADRAGGDHLSRQRQVVAAQYQAVAATDHGGRDR